MDDAALLASFERAAVTAEAWNHRAHVRVAWLLLRRDGFDGALASMRSGIRRLNAALGVVDGPASGYHETLTCAFLAAIWAAARDGGAAADSEAFCDAHPHLLARRLPLTWYTRERMMSADAKRRFVAPDVAPLPAPPGWSWTPPED